MEGNPKRISQIILAVLFVGVILSGTIFFSISYFMNQNTLEANISPENQGNSRILPEPDFNSAFYNNTQINEFIDKVGFYLFRKLENDHVMIGKNNFLFCSKKDGMDYGADYRGEIPYSQEELEKILLHLSQRELVYKEDGISYLVAVIPNAQTVYDEYMPFYMGECSENTRLRQLTRYVQEKSTLNFVNLEAALRSHKEEDILYNNTENSLNSLGAYYCYAEIFNHLPEEMREKNSLVTDLINEISVHYIDGKDLAIEANVEKLVKNKTLSLNSDIDSFRYQILESGKVVETTYVKPGYKNQLSITPAVMVDFNQEWDKIQFMPYLSNTYGCVGYKNNYLYSSVALNMVTPRTVIQIIREEDLATLLDDAIHATYAAEIPIEEDPLATKAPVLLGTSQIDRRTTAIMGIVEVGSVITISGKNIPTRTETAQDDRFFIDVKMERGMTDTISLIAKLPDKKESIPLTVNVSYDDNVSAKTVLVGKDSQLHYPDTLADYWGTNLFKENQLKSLLRKHQRKIEQIRQATGKNTKYIYVIPPNPFTVYPETAPDAVTAKKHTDNSRLKQFMELMKGNEDVIVLDLTSVMLDKKKEGKLYYQTDTHWNLLGAYYGYEALMKEIAKDFPAAAPHPITDYTIFKEYGNGGDLVSFLGVNQSTVQEHITFCTPNFETQANYFPLGDENGVVGSFADPVRSKIDNPELPTALMMRDSFGNNLVSSGFVGEHFSDFVSQAMWDHNLDMNLVKEIKPDYIIHVLVERNMSIVLQ